MAIVKNFWLQGASKRLAGAVLYEAMGQTRQRELAASVSNPRTTAQMTQRIKWSNLVNFYRANASWMKYAFENKKQTQSEYNKFMSLNVSSSRIALTKQAAAAGACVADSYIMTQGSLPSIEWSAVENGWGSNIFLGNGFEINAETTVGAFSAALIYNNPAMREGDQLSLIRVTQMVNAFTTYPYVIVRKYEVLLDTTSTALVNDYIPVDIISNGTVGGENVVVVGTLNRKGAFCMILSRTISGKTYVSSQSLILVNNNDTISLWSSNSAVQAAIDSYGESEDAFLSTVSAAAATGQPIANSVLSMTFDGTVYGPGAKTLKADDLDRDIVILEFSQALTGLESLGIATIYFTGGNSYTSSNVSIQSGKLQIVMPDLSKEDPDEHLFEINVVVDGVQYTIRFASSSEYTSGGLEE